MGREIKVVLVNPFEGKDTVLCKGKDSNDNQCLNNSPPVGGKMIVGHMCGAGTRGRGVCSAVFANPEQHPELFEEPL